jgi:hypothetical protein
MLMRMRKEIEYNRDLLMFGLWMVEVRKRGRRGRRGGGEGGEGGEVEEVEKEESWKVGRREVFPEADSVEEEEEGVVEKEDI